MIASLVPIRKFWMILSFYPPNVQDAFPTQAQPPAFTKATEPNWQFRVARLVNVTVGLLKKAKNGRQKCRETAPIANLGREMQAVI